MIMDVKAAIAFEANQPLKLETVQLDPPKAPECRECKFCCRLLSND